ncbi:hypothetical protein [Microseira wollei]|uniref:Uncharacterized protein n=1 Tax=Microseira wollei NIES-4236 TaxID=2530354 RepID=A0AAV3X5D9_9CYAN|nr:hypothetical protein [Microseira wollei]GET35407.1 hypothetical protein MiSe_01490 [Microseira wollei NIES-4236]
MREVGKKGVFKADFGKGYGLTLQSLLRSPDVGGGSPARAFA